MTRLRRLRETDRIFFVTTNLAPGHSDLSHVEFDLLIDVFKAARFRLDFAFCGYVLMPDHWHALIWPSFPLTITKVMMEIKDVSTDLFNRRRRVAGQFWQHGFFDRFVRNRGEFNRRLEYMHLNPVRKGLVTSPEDWCWSSHNNFSLDRSIVAACPIKIDYIHLSDEYRG
jgi:putative transposase